MFISVAVCNFQFFLISTRQDNVPQGSYITFSSSLFRPGTNVIEVDGKLTFSSSLFRHSGASLPNLIITSFSSSLFRHRTVEPAVFRYIFQFFLISTGEVEGGDGKWRSFSSSLFRQEEGEKVAIAINSFSSSLFRLPAPGMGRGWVLLSVLPYFDHVPASGRRGRWSFSSSLFRQAALRLFNLLISLSVLPYFDLKPNMVG